MTGDRRNRIPPVVRKKSETRQGKSTHHSITYYLTLLAQPGRPGGLVVNLELFYQVRFESHAAVQISVFMEFFFPHNNRHQLLPRRALNSGLSAHFDASQRGEESKRWILLAIETKARTV